MSRRRVHFADDLEGEEEEDDAYALLDDGDDGDEGGSAEAGAGDADDQDDGARMRVRERRA